MAPGHTWAYGWSDDVDFVFAHTDIESSTSRKQNFTNQMRPTVAMMSRMAQGRKQGQSGLKRRC